jgi:NADH-quinone oxidoreductase subunit H
MDAVFLVSTLLKILLVFGGVMSLVLLLTWQERKQSALMQDRIGANRASILGFRLFGLIHSLADGLKLMSKETFIPAQAEKLLYRLAPVLAASFAMMAFAFIPFGGALSWNGRSIPLCIVDSDVGILFVFAMLSLSVYGVVLAGWSSGNKYAFLGGMRACSQMISYEITMGATLLGLFLIFQTLDLNAIVHSQGEMIGGFLPKWGIFLQPLGFLLFLTAGVAETKRVPFDLPEGESEIIGYYVEYGGMRFGLFMMTDFIETVLIAALVTTLFLGGWQVPFLVSTGFHFPGGRRRRGKRALPLRRGGQERQLLAVQGDRKSVV